MQTGAVVRFFVRVLVLIAVVVAAAVVALMVVNQRAAENDQVVIVEVPFTSDGVAAATVGRIIFVDADRSRDADLLAHELVHVCQWEQEGIEFLWEYSTEFVANYEEFGDVRESYLHVSFEQEAREGSPNCDIDAYNVVRQ